MTVKEQTMPTRSELSDAQSALLDERLRRAKQVAGRPADARPGIPRRSGNADIPLSFAQQRLWFLDQLEPRSAVYNVCQAVSIHGALQVDALEQALNEIIRRHEVLRTNFVATDGRPVQVISPERTLRLDVFDLSGWQDGTGNEELQRRLRDESRRPFDLSRDLLLRAVLIRTSAVEHTLMLMLHHIISDGWSVGILFREIAALYPGYSLGEPVPLPELSVQYGDYVFWERETMQGATLERLLAYWRKQLEGPLPVLELPVDHPRSVAPMSRGAAQIVQLSRPLTHALKALGQQEGATLFMTLLGAFQVLLHRWTGQEDIVVGSVVAGRRKVELERLIGFFVNTLVFRGDLSGEPTFRQLLVRTRETAVGALAHQDLPFERLVNELRPDRNLSRNPLFQVMFVLQNAPMSPTSMPQLQMQPIDVDTGTSKFDLTLSMVETADGLRAAMEYNADLFEPPTVGRMLAGFQTLLESIAANPDQPISRLAVLTPAERHQLLSEWNQTATSYPRTLTVQQVFEQQAMLTPEAVALEFESRTLTYRELDAQSNQLARWLQRAGVGRETLVAVSLDRSLELIIALLGILKAGGTYVSLDPTYPAERLAFMLRDTAAPVLLTQQQLRDRLNALVRDGAGAAPTVLCLDSEWTRVAGESDAAVRSGGEPDDLAYVSYTSGSTGQPKGVCVPHRGVVRLVRNAEYAHFGPDEVFLQFAPIAFDASTFEIWGALLNGGRLVIYPPGPSSLAELGEFIESHAVTTLWFTAGLFHQMIEEQVDHLQNVRQLLAGGDVLSVPHVARALEQLPRTQLINGYGPTENTTFTCCHRVTAPPLPGRSVPIGRPISNTQVYILDREFQPVPVGVPGELYTGGDGLARGYLNRPELTAERFVPNPFVALRPPEPGIKAGAKARLYRTGDRVRWLPDGSIEFLGRADRQVKIRGFRIEPGEVEAVLRQHEAVKDCAVLVHEDEKSGKSLVAYVTICAGTVIATDDLRTFLQEKLPAYLVPSSIVQVPEFPLSPNGKVDVAALMLLGKHRTESKTPYMGPKDAVEQQLVEIWKDVLGVPVIGIRDRFFDLGGHSLLAARMASEIEREFGGKLPLSVLLHAPTVEQLARAIRDRGLVGTGPSSLVEIQPRGNEPPIFWLHTLGGGGGAGLFTYQKLAEHLGPTQPSFGLVAPAERPTEHTPKFEAMAAFYVDEMRRVQPAGPYYLGGYCFGGVLAYEMARQLHASGEQVGRVILLDSFPPNPPGMPGRLSGAFIRHVVATTPRWIAAGLRQPNELIRRTRKAGGRIWQRIRNLVLPSAKSVSALHQLEQLVDMEHYPPEYKRLAEAHWRAMLNYSPLPFPGRVALFRPDRPRLLTFTPEFQWRRLVPQVDVTVVGGTHEDILADPQAAHVAKALTELLQRDRVGRS